jgi:hypothetical protein
MAVKYITVNGIPSLDFGRKYCPIERAKWLYKKIRPDFISSFKDLEAVRSGYNKLAELEPPWLCDDDWQHLLQLIEGYFVLLESNRRMLTRIHTQSEWELKKLEYNYSCAYCGQTLFKLTKDHIIPVALGGTDEIDNIVPACQRCNSMKHKKPVGLFLMEMGR